MTFLPLFLRDLSLGAGELPHHMAASQPTRWQGEDPTTSYAGSSGNRLAGRKGSEGAEAGAESQRQDQAGPLARLCSSPLAVSRPADERRSQGDSSLTPTVQREPTEVPHPPGPRAHRPPPPDSPGLQPRRSPLPPHTPGCPVLGRTQLCL